MNLETPGGGIRLSEDKLKWLGGAVHERVELLEQDHFQYFSDINTWWKHFEATPRFSQKDWPFKNASNVVVPLIQSHTITLVNRLLGMIFGDRAIWMARTENTDFEETANNVVRWLNWAANGNDFDLQGPVTDWLTELIAIGSSVLALNWTNDTRDVLVSNGGRSLRPRPVNFGRGPLIEHVPRQQMLWNTRYDITRAPEVVREFHLGWHEINGVAQRSSKSRDTGWYVDQLEACIGKEGLSSHAQETAERLQKTDSIRENHQPNDFREYWADWPTFRGFADELEIDGDSIGHPCPTIVVTYHYKTQRVVRVRTNPYNLPGKPFFSGFYRKRPGRSHGVGLCKDLFAMQDSETVLLNQAIDSRTRANSLWAVTDQRSLLSKPMDPRHPFYVPVGGRFEPLNLDKNVLADTNLFNVVNIISERLTGQADPVMGRESRSGGHPSPATSTLALLGQSDQMIGALRMTVRNTIGKLGESIAVLYQQFETNETGRLERTLGMKDADSAKQYLFPTEPIPGNIIFDVVGMSATQNPQAEISRNIQLAQMSTNYFTFLSNVFQQYIQARQMQLPPDLMALANQYFRTAMTAQTGFQTRLLEAGGVDDIEQYILTFQRAQTDIRGAFDQLGATQGGSQPPINAAVGSPSGPPPGRAAFAPGTLGGGTLQ